RGRLDRLEEDRTLIRPCEANGTKRRPERKRRQSPERATELDQRARDDEILHAARGASRARAPQVLDDGGRRRTRDEGRLRRPHERYRLPALADGCRQ